MPATTTATTNDLTTAPSRTPLLAALGIAASALLTAIGTFWDIGGKSGQHRDASEWLVTLGIIAVGATLVYGLGLMRVRKPGRRAVVLAAIGVPSVMVFWTGLPMLLVTASISCALTEKDRRGSYGVASKVAFGLCALITVGAVNLAFVG